MNIEDFESELYDLKFNLDEDMINNLYRFFLLEQCVYIYNKEFTKVKRIFDTLDKFENFNRNNIKELKDFLNIYLYMTTEYSCGTNILCIIYDY